MRTQGHACLASHPSPSHFHPALSCLGPAMPRPVPTNFHFRTSWRDPIHPLQSYPFPSRPSPPKPRPILFLAAPPRLAPPGTARTALPSAAPCCTQSLPGLFCPTKFAGGKIARPARPHASAHTRPPARTVPGIHRSNPTHSLPSDLAHPIQVVPCHSVTRRPIQPLPSPPFPSPIIRPSLPISSVPPTLPCPARSHPIRSGPFLPRPFASCPIAAHPSCASVPGPNPTRPPTHPSSASLPTRPALTNPNPPHTAVPPHPILSHLSVSSSTRPPPPSLIHTSRPYLVRSCPMSSRPYLCFPSGPLRPFPSTPYPPTDSHPSHPVPKFLPPCTTYRPRMLIAQNHRLNELVPEIK